MMALYKPHKRRVFLQQVMMGSLYQASQEHTILAAGDDGLPIPGLTRADYPCAMWWWPPYTRPHKSRRSLQQAMMASLYQASQEQTILKQVMMASLNQASQEQTIPAAGDDGLPIPGLTRAEYPYTMLGPQQDRGTWLYREAGFTEWSCEWGNYLTKEKCLPGRDSQKREPLSCRDSPEREQREIPGLVWKWLAGTGPH